MKRNRILLGVNVDHIATVRQARKEIEPDPVAIALLAEKAGADGITVHLREDRRHIQLHDVERLKQELTTRLNLEMAATQEMVAIAKKIKPAFCCIVPEKREEVTTEGGLNVVEHKEHLKECVTELKQVGIQISFFVDPEVLQIEAAKSCGADIVEIHTGSYANAKTGKSQQHELKQIQTACAQASEFGLIVNAGHGLNYQNVQAVAAIPQIHELNIGFAIVARALTVGIFEAVKTMKQLMLQAQ